MDNTPGATPYHNTIRRKVNHLKNTLKHQHKIREDDVIPYKYLPSNYLETNDKITTEFKEQFKQLFNKHLEKAITANMIDLEIQEAKLRYLELHAEPPTPEHNEPATSTPSRDITQIPNEGTRSKKKPNRSRKRKLANTAKHPAKSDINNHKRPMHSRQDPPPPPPSKKQSPFLAHGQPLLPQHS